MHRAELSVDQIKSDETASNEEVILASSSKTEDTNNVGFQLHEPYANAEPSADNFYEYGEEFNMQPVIEDAADLHATLTEFYTILIRLNLNPQCKSLFKNVKEKFVKYFRNLNDGIIWSEVELSRLRTQISIIQQDPKSELTPDCEQRIFRILDGSDEQAQAYLHQVVEEHDLVEQFSTMDSNGQAAKNHQTPLVLQTGLSKIEANQVIFQPALVEEVSEIDPVPLDVKIDLVFEYLLLKLEEAKFTNYLFLADMEVYQFFNTDNSLVTYCQPSESFYHSSNSTNEEIFTNMFEGLKQMSCFIAKPNEYDYLANEGRTLLMLAASYGREAMIREALTQASAVVSADEISQFVNKATFTQKTALHLAVERNHIECVRILLNAGASVDLPDCFDHTPMYYALPQDPMIILLLLQRGAPYASAYEVMTYLKMNPRSAVVTACAEFVYLPAIKENLLRYHSSPFRDALISHVTIFENMRKTGSSYTAPSLELNSQALTIYDPKFLGAAAEAIKVARIKVIEMEIGDFIDVLVSRFKLENLKSLVSREDALEKLVFKSADNKRNAREIMLTISNLQEAVKSKGLYITHLPTKEKILNPRKRMLDEEAFFNDLLNYYNLFGYDNIELLFQFQNSIWGLLDRLRLNEIRSLRTSSLATLCSGLFAYSVVHGASLDEQTRSRLPAAELINDNDSRLSVEDKKLLSEHQEIEKEKYEIDVRLTR